MTPRIIWMIAPHDVIAPYHVHDAVAAFYTKFSMKPNVVRLTSNDYSNLIKHYNSPTHVLEKGKEYGTYITSVGGPILLDLMEESNSQLVNQNATMTNGMSSGSAFFVEFDQVDKMFEKVVLGEP